MQLDDSNQEDNILKWLNGELNYIKEEDQERIRQIQRNLALYKGIQYNDQNTRNFKDDPRQVNRLRNPRKLVVNHLYDLTEQRVSRIVKFRPAVAALPTHDEYQDRLAAKTVEAWIKHMFYMNELDGNLGPAIARSAQVTGEGYNFIEWDPDMGEEHPTSKKAREKDGKVDVPLLDNSGKQAFDDKGNPIRIEQEVKVGDVRFKHELTTNMFLEKKNSFEDVNYAFRCQIWDVDELRLKFPESASKIKATEDVQIYDFERMESRKGSNQVVAYYFYHKDKHFLPGGREIFFTSNVVLKNEKLPYSHGRLPFTRFKDVDIPHERYGVSFYNNVKQLTSQYNNVTNMIVRAQALMAHAKWVMPAGACKLEQLGNDHTVVQYKGPTPPQMVQANPTPTELFKFREQIKEEFQQISGVFGVSRGEPPPGVKAGVALQFLNEQENERSNSNVLAWNEFIRDTAVMSLSVAKDFYEPSDERTIRVVGKNNQWIVKELDPDDLNRDYDIRIQNTSALPRSKAARTQTLLDLNESFPEQVSAERVLDMLDFSQEQKFIDGRTQAVKTAEIENDKILEGGGAGEVFDWEDHIVHWEIHVRDLQGYNFKTDTPKKTRENFIDHIRAHERLMLDRAKLNPIFAERLAALKQFPLIFKEAIIPAQPLPGELPGVPPQGLQEQQPPQPNQPPPISEQGGLQAEIPKQPNIQVGV